MPCLFFQNNLGLDLNLGSCPSFLSAEMLAKYLNFLVLFSSYEDNYNDYNYNSKYSISARYPLKCFMCINQFYLL